MVEGKPNTLLIPGSFDVLQPADRIFIKNCIAAARSETTVDKVVVGLVPDRNLHTLGKYHPFFPVDWRQEDVTKWYDSEYDDSVAFEEFAPDPSSRTNSETSRHRIAVVCSKYENTSVADVLSTKAQQIIYIPQVEKHYKADIEQTLRDVRDESFCDWRVGAVLLRDGVIIDKGHNGDNHPDSCLSCSRRLGLQSTEPEAMLRPSSIGCDFPHAEIKASVTAQTDDHLLTTTSPCESCSNAIVEKGIKRVVYLRPYHNMATLEPVENLRRQGIQIRQAGI